MSGATSARRLGAKDLTVEQQAVLDETKDILVVGRPGTGKTSIALLKALKHLRSSQDEDDTVLFLSFSRAAVQRIEAAAKLYVPRAVSRRLQITTFHAFCFNVIKSHARLVGMPRFGGIVLPHEEKMVEAEATDVAAEYARLERESGRLTFERLIDLTLDLLRRHQALRSAYARAHLLILVDEYQDTNDKQDEIIDLLASPGQVVYLGDPEQRIYDWLKDVRADRFERLIERRGPRRIDLPVKCHRSGASDLIPFGRAVLSGAALRAKPSDVSILRYAVGKFPHQLRVAIVSVEKAARKKLGQGVIPEIAVMSYKNGFVARISNELRQTTDSFVHPFSHRLHVGLEEVGPAWWLALSLLECSGTPSPSLVADALFQLGRYERAQGGQGRLKRAVTLFEVAEAFRSGEKVTKRSLKDLPVRLAAIAAAFTGDPGQDLSKVINLLRDTGGGYFEDAVETLGLRSPTDAGPTFLGSLADTFAEHGCYSNARATGEAFLLREHLVRAETGGGGRIVMTLHKSKGKEFDGVVIVDGPGEADGLVLRDDDDKQSRSRRLLAMAIARARHSVGIVTPAYRPCPLLPAYVT